MAPGSSIYALRSGFPARAPGRSGDSGGTRTAVAAHCCQIRPPLLDCLGLRGLDELPCQALKLSNSSYPGVDAASSITGRLHLLGLELGLRFAERVLDLGSSSRSAEAMRKEANQRGGSAPSRRIPVNGGGDRSTRANCPADRGALGATSSRGTRTWHRFAPM
jgi:hypothetical protein